MYVCIYVCVYVYLYIIYAYIYILLVKRVYRHPGKRRFYGLSSEGHSGRDERTERQLKYNNDNFFFYDYYYYYFINSLSISIFPIIINPFVRVSRTSWRSPWKKKFKYII